MLRNISSLVIVSVLLVACQPPEPMIFGVPQSQWNQLTHQQQDVIIAGYNQRKQIETQNAPIENAINTAGNVLQHRNNGLTPQPTPSPNFRNFPSSQNGSDIDKQIQQQQAAIDNQIKQSMNGM